MPGLWQRHAAWERSDHGARCGTAARHCRRPRRRQWPERRQAGLPAPTLLAVDRAHHSWEPDRFRDETWLLATLEAPQAHASRPWRWPRCGRAVCSAMEVVRLRGPVTHRLFLLVTPGIPPAGKRGGRTSPRVMDTHSSPGGGRQLAGDRQADPGGSDLRQPSRPACREASGNSGEGLQPNDADDTNNPEPTQREPRYVVVLAPVSPVGAARALQSGRPLGAPIEGKALARRARMSAAVAAGWWGGSVAALSDSRTPGIDLGGQCVGPKPEPHAGPARSHASTASNRPIAARDVLVFGESRWQASPGSSSGLAGSIHAVADCRLERRHRAACALRGAGGPIARVTPTTIPPPLNSIKLSFQDWDSTPTSTPPLRRLVFRLFSARPAPAAVGFSASGARAVSHVACASAGPGHRPPRRGKPRTELLHGRRRPAPGPAGTQLGEGVVAAGRAGASRDAKT